MNSKTIDQDGESADKTPLIFSPEVMDDAEKRNALMHEVEERMALESV